MKVNSKYSVCGKKKKGFSGRRRLGVSTSAMQGQQGGRNGTQTTTFESQLTDRNLNVLLHASKCVDISIKSLLPFMNNYLVGHQWVRFPTVVSFGVRSGIFVFSSVISDLKNPKSNKNKTPGFTDQERDGFTKLLSEGFTDTFRHLYPKTEQMYSFWTYMGNCRAKNVGW